MIIKTIEDSNFGMQFFPEPFDDLKKDKSNLAKRLLNIRGVDIVEIEEDHILIKKENEYDWQVLKPIIISYISEHKIIPVYDKDSIEYQIVSVINSKVRPGVRADGGDVHFESFKDGVVYLKMSGACVGCAYSQMTLKDGIERVLKHFLPEVTEVRNLND